MCRDGLITSLKDFTMETLELNSQVINQIDHFLNSMDHQQRNEFRRFLLDMKQEQDEGLFALEKEYLSLVQQRRLSLLTYLKESSAGGGKRDISEGLKQMHASIRSELDNFLRVRVYEGWQEAKLLKQIEALKQRGVPPAVLFYDGSVEYQRQLLSLIMNKL